MDVLIEVLGIPIVDWFTRALIVYIIFTQFGEFIMDTFSQWRRGGFKAMSTNFLKAILIIILAVIILGFGLPTIVQWAYNITMIFWEQVIIRLFKLITRT